MPIAKIDELVCVIIIIKPIIFSLLIALADVDETEKQMYGRSTAGQKAMPGRKPKKRMKRQTPRGHGNNDLDSRTSGMVTPSGVKFS